MGRDPRRSSHGNVSITIPTSHFPSADLLEDRFHQRVLRHVKGARDSDEIERRFDPDIDHHEGGGLISQLAAGGTVRKVRS